MDEYRAWEVKVKVMKHARVREDVSLDPLAETIDELSTSLMCSQRISIMCFILFWRRSLGCMVPPWLHISIEIPLFKYSFGIFCDRFDNHTMYSGHTSRYEQLDIGFIFIGCTMGGWGGRIQAIIRCHWMAGWVHRLTASHTSFYIIYLPAQVWYGINSLLELHLYKVQYIHSSSSWSRDPTYRQKWTLYVLPVKWSARGSYQGIWNARVFHNTILLLKLSKFRRCYAV